MGIPVFPVGNKCQYCEDVDTPRCSYVDLSPSGMSHFNQQGYSFPDIWNSGGTELPTKSSD